MRSIFEPTGGVSIRATRRRPGLGRALRSCVATMLAGVAFVPAAAASAPPPSGSASGPQWALTDSTMPTALAPGQAGDSYLAVATNTGGATTSGPITLVVRLPAGLTETSAAIRHGFGTAGECKAEVEAGEVTAVKCSSAAAIAPGEQLVLQILVNVAEGVSGPLASSAVVAGGGASQEASAAATTEVGVAAANAGIAPGTFFSTTSSDQAGAHPNASAGFTLTTIRRKESNGEEFLVPAGSLKEVVVNTPAGLIGSTRAAPRCSYEQFSVGNCPADSEVGIETADMDIGNAYAPGGPPNVFSVPLYNLTPPKGVPAEFAFHVLSVAIIMRATVRTGSDYGLTVSVGPASQGAMLYSSETMFYGVPAQNNGGGATPVPLIYNPTACGSPLASTVGAGFYQFPSLPLAEALSAPTQWVGCEALSFPPRIRVSPDGAAAAHSPIGLRVDLEVPQSDAAEELASSAVKGATITLPEGLTINPAAANGLAACSERQAGFERLEADGQAIFSSSEAECPEASRLGTVRIETPLLGEELEGYVYQAAQTANPFGSLLALYAVAKAPQRGVLVKLAGRVATNPTTGQVTASFQRTPQLPFERFEVNLFGGRQAALASRGCGVYRANSMIEPWSGTRVVEPFAEFALSTGPEGQPCAGGNMFAPAFSAGTSNPVAGGFTPFDLTLTRGDTEQDFSTVSMTMPRGLEGMISKVPLCGEPQANAGDCPADSKIGHVITEAGVGSDPITLPQPGKPEDPVYLTGPYRGAPFGLSIAVPAEAGPLDLGTVIVRARIEVDPQTGQVSVVSDPMPTMLQGIPLDVKAIHVVVDRPEFMFNPTSCKPSSVTGTIGAVEGASAAVSSRFQAANCAALPFKPSFSATAHAHHSKAGGEYLRVDVGSKAGQANIARIHVTLPKKLPSRLSTLKLACPAAQFAADPASCPASSFVGTVAAYTPVLPVPLRGPALFVSHGGAGFPNLDFVMQGDGVTIDLVGDTFISKAGITTSTFSSVPDVPISSFELTLPAGPHSALGGNGDLCAAPLYMPTTITGQNGAVLSQRTRIKLAGCKPQIRVVGKRSGRRSATITLTVPAAGKLTVSGADVERHSKRLARAGRAKIAVRLSGRGRRLLARHPGRRLAVAVRLRFQPAKGRAIGARTKVLIG